MRVHEVLERAIVDLESRRSHIQGSHTVKGVQIEQDFVTLSKVAIYTVKGEKVFMIRLTSAIARSWIYDVLWREASIIDLGRRLIVCFRPRIVASVSDLRIAEELKLLDCDVIDCLQL